MIRRDSYSYLDYIMMESLQAALDYTFTDVNLLHLALTHPSARYEWMLPDDNQRLEFLGDAVLGLIAAEHGYRMDGALNEGNLTSMRSALSNTSTLATIARQIGLGQFLVLGKGEESSGGRDKENNLADALEAVIGACYLDGGLDASRRVFRRLFLPLLTREPVPCAQDNPKGRLQEWTQSKGLPPPQYELVSEQGPAHQKTFIIKVMAGQNHVATGAGNSKRSAEADAARNLINQFITGV